MIIHDAADTFTTLIDAAIMWARIIGATLALVLCVVAFSVGPLIAPHARRGSHTPAGAPQTPSRDSRTTGAPERAAEARTRPRPSWAHEQPINIEEAA